jgi:iron complex outermembrane recepter protein
MRSSHSLRVAVAAMLISHAALSQESRTEEVIVTSTALRESPLAVAQPTTVVAGDDLRRQIASSIGETLSSELGVSSTYFGPSASRPVIRGLGGDRVQVLQDGLAALDVSSLSQDHAVTLESVVSQQIEIIKGPAAPALRQRRFGRIGECRQHARADGSAGETPHRCSGSAR